MVAHIALSLDYARHEMKTRLKLLGVRTLNKALKSYDIPTDFGQWGILTADLRVWQQRIGIRAPCPRPATTLIHGKWRELFDGPT